MIVELTKSFIDTQLVVPAGVNKIEFCDTNVRGLLIQANASGKMLPTYFLRFKRDGKTAYDRLGTIKELTLPQARKLATERKVEHAKVAKQAPEVKSVLADMTLDAFWTDLFHPHIKIHLRSHKRGEQLYRLRVLPKFGSTKLKDINKREVQLFQNELAKENLSPASIDHHIKLLKRMLSACVDWGYLEVNTLRGFRLINADNAKENYLDLDQVNRLVEVLDANSQLMPSWIIKCLVCTGMRLREVTDGRWAEVDLDAGIWRVPAERSKSKKAMVKYLSDSAKYVLQQVGTQEKSEFIFPNPQTDKPYTTITRVWYRLRKLAGIPSNVRLHDLRHTYASLLVQAGRSLYEAQRLMSHQDHRSTMRYAHLAPKTLQEAANAVSIIVPKLKTELESNVPLPNGVVVPFTKAA